MKKKTLNSVPRIPLSHQITWYVCRGILFAWGAVMLFAGYTTEFLEAVFAIIFTFLWDLFQLLGGKTFITLVPYRVQTMLNLLICFGVAVGSTINKFTTFEHIDIPEHFFSGYIAAAGSYELAVIIQSRQPKDKKLSPALAAMFGLGFAVMLLTGWEFYEFTMDRLYGLNLQRSGFNTEAGLIDTMIDLIVGTAGALTGMFITAFSKAGMLKKKGKKK
ncbi:MAG: hypothetical protein PUE34_07630 [Clostridiaceae bacterium]|nr:hypothetical protein [Clostridiaceae bacterium]